MKTILKQIYKLISTRKAYKFFIKDWISLSDLHTASFLSNTMRFSVNLKPLLLEKPLAQNIVVLAPHPDDEILGPGGTLIKSISAGKKVSVIYLTNPEPQPRRTIEVKEVAKKVSFDTYFLNMPVSNISLKIDSLKKCAEILNKIKPGCIFLPFLFDDHDDHRRASEFLFNIIEKNFYKPSKLEIWGYQVYTSIPSNVIIDISEVAEKKAEAIKLFASQMSKRNYVHYSLGLNAFNSRFIKSSKNEKKYVESFFVVPWVEYAELCKKYFKDPKGAYYEKNYLD